MSEQSSVGETRGKQRSKGGALNSVFVRCAAIMALTTLAVAVVMFAQSSKLAHDLTVKAVVDQAEKGTWSSAQALVKPVRFKALAKIEEELAAVMDGAGDVLGSAVVTDAEGAALSVQGRQDASLAPLMAAARETGAVQVAQDGLARAEPILAGPEGPVIGVLGMVWSAEAALEATWDSKIRIFVTSAAIFLVMMAATLWLLRRSLGRPLKQLAAAVDRISHGDYDSPVGMASRRDELGRIAAQMEELTQTLRSSRDAEEKRQSQITKQMEMVRHLAHALNLLAEGALTHQIEEPFPEEYETLRRNYNNALQSLRTVISEVGENASGILANAQQIASASDDLSQRTETQAATLEQSTAALEELLNSVNAAADHARQVDETVRHTRQIAVQNGTVMQSAISAMGEIEKSSEQISDIIGVIDDIAFQTNLLALNAGVEAARAGSSGKGFAVVASEVRGLAQRSAEAAQQIKDLILDSGTQVQNGVKLVERAGDALEEVVQKVAEVSDMVTNIAHGAGEQADGLKEINVGIVNLDRVTQQNAAMVEESTAAAHMLRSDATAMSDLVRRFDIGEDNSGTTTQQRDRSASAA